MTILSHSIIQTEGIICQIRKNLSQYQCPKTLTIDLESLLATRFEVPVSIQKAINFMLEKETKKNGKRKPS